MYIPTRMEKIKYLVKKRSIKSGYGGVQPLEHYIELSVGYSTRTLPPSPYQRGLGILFLMVAFRLLSIILVYSSFSPFWLILPERSHLLKYSCKNIDIVSFIRHLGLFLINKGGI